MFENRYGKTITIIAIVLIILIILILGYLGIRVMTSFNDENDRRQEVERYGNQGINRNTENTEDVNVEDVVPIITPENTEAGTSSGTSKTKTYKGFVMVGTIEIPKTNLKCPVLQSASSSAIEVAVGIYAGPGLNKVGNTVIAGHNYRNGTFFSDNKNIAKGDKIYITDETGKKVIYTVYNIFTTAPEDLEYVSKSTEGKRVISLTTCTDDTKSRLIVQASAD